LSKYIYSKISLIEPYEVGNSHIRF